MQLSLFSDVLARYADRYRPLRIEPLGGGGGFSGAVIVRVQCPAGTFCLRGWPADAPPPERLRGLHRLLRTICEQGGTQTPVPVAARDGATLVSVRGTDWQLEPWMPGRADFHDRPTDARLRSAMTVLATWHRAAATFRPRPEEARWFFQAEHAPSPAVGERLLHIDDWRRGKGPLLRHELERAAPSPFREVGRRLLDLFDRHAPRIAGDLQAAARLRFRLQPCLRDVWHDHLLFTGDDLTGLIDPAACRSEHVAADLSRLLGSLLGDDRPRWEFALGEYRKHRPLTLDELGLIELLDRSGLLLSGLTWLDRHYLQRQTFEHPPRVVARLRLFLSRLEHLRL